MTLQKLLLDICDIAIHEKLVNYAAAGNSIYQMNALTVNDYPFVFVSPTGNHVVNKGFTTYSITLFYVDRLLNDDTNDVNIFSASVEELKNLVRKIKGLDDVIRVGDGYNVNLFTEPERFSDRCAGAYATINVTIKNDTLCGV